MLTWWAFLVAMLSQQLPETMVAASRRAWSGRLRFPAVHLITSNPFERLLPGRTEGVT